MSINNKRSYTEYTITQPTTDFAIGFDDFDEGSKDVILVTLNGVPVESLGYAAIRKNENTVTITPAITEGVVRLTRETGIDEPFHKFTAGALFSAKSMDENFQQVRHSQQEVRDGFVFLENNTSGVVEAAKTATARANAAAESIEALDITELQTDIANVQETVSEQKYDTALINTSKYLGGVATSQALKNSTSISIQEFGGADDGVSFNDLALMKAITYLGTVGGGTLNIPHILTGVYLFKEPQVFSVPNVHIAIGDTVVIDTTNMISTDANVSVWTFAGSIDTLSTPLTATTQRGDSTITVSNATTYQAGDLLYLQSQRNALHPDGGLEWQLGVPTGSTYDTHACYYGEPVFVSKVVGNTITTMRPVIFPDYLPNKLSETSVLARASSFVQKLNLLQNIRITGGTFLGSRGCSMIAATYCEDFYIRTTGRMGSATGQLLRNTYSLRTVADCVVYHSEAYYIVVDHSRYNSLKDLSSWYSYFKLTDYYGTQCIDCTYVINGGVTLHPTYNIRSYDSQEQGLTFHAGAYGWVVEDAVVYRCRQTGLTLRSRYGHIKSASIYGRSTNRNLAGIQFSQWATDIELSSFYIEGFHSGISTGDNNPIDEPMRKNINIGTGTINRVDFGIRLFNRGDSLAELPVNNTVCSGVVIGNVVVDQVSNAALYIGQQVHGVVCKGLHVNKLTGDAVAVKTGVNTLNHKINYSIGSLEGNSQGHVIQGILTDSGINRVVHPYQRIKIVADIMNHTSTKSATQTNTPTFYGELTSAYTVTDEDDGLLISLKPTTGTNINVTLPYYLTTVSVGVKVTFLNVGLGTVSFITDVVGSSSIINVPQLASHSVVTVQKLPSISPIIWSKV